jgi:hypothetical protein
MRDYDRPHGTRVDDGPAPREITADNEHPVDLRLTRKLADVIDGVDITGRAVGDVFQVTRVRGAAADRGGVGRRKHETTPGHRLRRVVRRTNRGHTAREKPSTFGVGSGCK